MKKLFVLTMMALVCLTASAKKDWKGKVVDEKGAPVAYANVAVLSKTDSTVVCGAVTGEDGTFNIVTKEDDGVMMVAMIGYQTAYLKPVNGMVITLKDDAAVLESASVLAIMPKTKLTGEGLQTAVRGSVLENAGSANDVLGKTPGIIKGQNGLEVIGKGAPLVYINGRRISDTSELDRLPSNEIQSIEVISNPGAQYDATVRAVVRIRTVKRKGEGFGFNLDASDSQALRWAKGNSSDAAFNANYRTGGVDIFAGVNFSRATTRQESDIIKNMFGVNKSIKNDGNLLGEYLTSSLYGNAGVNWQISNSHSVGGKLEWSRLLAYDFNVWINDNVFEDDSQIDKLSTESHDTMGDVVPRTLGANLYYNGLVAGKLGIDVNFDYYGSNTSKSSASKEVSEMTHNASTSSYSNSGSKLYAAKAVLSYPIWMGQLQAGTEETFSRRTDNYTTDLPGILASNARINEDNVAVFGSYGFYVPKVGQMSAGLRYEHVRYNYEDELAPDNNLTRNYSNWFPTVSYSNVFGPVQVMLNYSVKTKRPSYDILSSAVRYNSRYILQSGNAQLQPEIIHGVNLTAVYKWMTFMVNYSRTDDAIAVWTYPVGEEGVVLSKPRNLDAPYRALQAYVNFTPTIGIWNLNYTVGVMPQWLSITAPDPREASGERVTRFNNEPLFFAQLFNTLSFKGGWQLELGAQLQSCGYTQNLRLSSPYVDLTAAVQKTLLKDGSLVLRLEGSDLAGMAHFNVDSDFGSHTVIQTNNLYQQKVKFSIRYKFNSTQSKYRGTGAGTSEKSRM